MRKNMKNKRTYIWAYLDGEKLIEVIRAALDNNVMVGDLKKKLIEENPGHEVTFKKGHHAPNERRRIALKKR